MIQKLLSSLYASELYASVFASMEFISTAIYKTDKVGATLVSLCASRCCSNKGDADESCGHVVRVFIPFDRITFLAADVLRVAVRAERDTSKRIQAAVRPKVAEQ